MENSSTDELKLLEMRQFETRDEFISAAQEFVAQRGYALSIKRSTKDIRVILGCDRGGNYRDRVNKPMENRIRTTSSRLIGCPFELHGKKKEGGQWMVLVKNSSHNHELSTDISGHPISRRFSKEEIARIKELIKSGVPTRQILSTLRQENPNLQSVSKTVGNLKAKLRNEFLGGRTAAQALLDELGKGGFTYDFLSDANGFLTHLFFVHPMSLALTKSYPSVFIMDCTYKTNKYKMPLLEIVGISSFNASFCSCFAFLRKEEKSDYIWALQMFKKIFGDNSLPSVFVTDREIALMNAIRVIFPTSAHIICTWHIEKNILAHCKRYFDKGEDFDGFLVDWTTIVNSFSEGEYIEALKAFEDKYNDKSLGLSYIRDTWLPYKEYFVSAWTDKYTHFGTRVSSRAESTHAMIKKYLQCRYVIRAKAGKKQSSKDGGGRTIHSAGASLRRYNELALKKDIQELLASWKPYFSASSSVFLHAPSNNRQLFFDGDKPLFFHNPHAIRNIPLTVRRPTFKEALRLYTLVSQVSSVDEETNLSTSASIKEDHSNESIAKNSYSEPSKSSERAVKGHKTNDTSVDIKKFDNVHISNGSESENGSDVLSTPLHEAAKSGSPQEILDLLEQGVNPCIKDERGRTPYMLAVDKEVRNTFRRFMALNPDKWDWNAAKVPSALTKEMEESQAAKQAEKDAKRKARAKELKKLRKAKEKKAQAEAAKSNNAAPNSSNAGQSGSRSSGTVSKEEELKAEREKRAAAAERRMAAGAALKAQGTGVPSSTADSKVLGASETGCSYCHDSLAGKVPFHRYNYKYCSTTCMHAHREILEDG